jgi:3-oxoacyl-[acyl-carrier protein] reductase
VFLPLEIWPADRFPMLPPMTSNTRSTSPTVANAALFFASDEANFITGVALPVDRGALVKVG